MAEVNDTKPSSAPAPVVAAPSGSSFVKRELNGATFLSLEHAAHMALVVIVPLLVASAIASVMGIWWGAADMPAVDLLYMPVVPEVTGLALMAITMVAAFIVLIPLLWLLDRRTRAEWGKRPGYAGRLAYKAPIYIAIGALGAGITLLKISLLSTIIASLAMIGVDGANIGSMYGNDFLSTLVSLIVLTFALWYAVMLAKGRDYGKTYGAVMAIIGGALAVALLITAVTTLHSKSDSNSNMQLDEYLKQYNSRSY